MNSDPLIRLTKVTKVYEGKVHESALQVTAVRDVSLEIMRGEIPAAALTSKPVKEVMDSCFNCKLCLSECPSQVDIPGLAVAARKEFVEAHGMPARNWILGHADRMAPGGIDGHAQQQFMALEAGRRA